MAREQANATHVAWNTTKHFNELKYLHDHPDRGGCRPTQDASCAPALRRNKLSAPFHPEPPDSIKPSRPARERLHGKRLHADLVGQGSQSTDEVYGGPLERNKRCRFRHDHPDRGPHGCKDVLESKTHPVILNPCDGVVLIGFERLGQAPLFPHNEMVALNHYLENQFRHDHPDRGGTGDAQANKAWLENAERGNTELHDGSERFIRTYALIVDASAYDHVLFDRCNSPNVVKIGRRGDGGDLATAENSVNATMQDLAKFIGSLLVEPMTVGIEEFPVRAQLLHDAMVALSHSLKSQFRHDHPDRGEIEDVHAKTANMTDLKNSDRSHTKVDDGSDVPPNGVLVFEHCSISNIILVRAGGLSAVHGDVTDVEKPHDVTLKNCNIGSLRVEVFPAGFCGTEDRRFEQPRV